MQAHRGRVFISHIHEEKQYATAIKTFIVDVIGLKNVSVFLSSDSWNIKPGQQWLNGSRRS